MEYSISLIVGMVTIIFWGGVMQGAIGFAYALFATPLLVWIGVPLPITIVIIAVCGFIQSGLGSWRLRLEVPWRNVWMASLIRLPSIIMGVCALQSLVFLSTGHVKMMVGFTICLLVGVQMFTDVKPVERVHPFWTGLALSGSGFLFGSVGMGGPPLVMWVMAHNWSSEKTRSFLFTVSMISAPFQIALLFLSFGPEILKSILVSFLLAPVVLLGSWVGIPLGNRMPKILLCKIAQWVLIIIGLSAAIPPFYQILINL